MIVKALRNIVERYPFAASFYRECRDFIDCRSKALTTPWGFTLAGHKDMALGIFEPQETDLVRNLLQDVDLLVNIGANVGYYCCHALSLGKKVIAVEPLHRNLRYLMKNIKDNGWQDMVEIFPVALSNNNNILDLFGGTTGASLVKGWSGCSENYKVNVPVLTLDRIIGEYLNSKNALIIVDIEGSELQMLYGALKTLASNPRPTWLIEICFNEHHPDAKYKKLQFRKIFEIFFELNYAALAIADEPYQITPNIVEKILSGDVLLNTHNFLFK